MRARIADGPGWGRPTRQQAVDIALPLLGVIVAVVTALVGHHIDRSGRWIGVPNPPFLLRYSPAWDRPVVACAVLAFALAVLLTPRLLRLPPVLFATATLLLTPVLRLALAFARGSNEWHEMFTIGPGGSFEASNEYVPALPALRYGSHIFLDRFAEIVPSLPVHAAGHTPGLLLVMHGLGITTGRGLAVLCIVVAALATPLVYLLGRRLLEERVARIGTLLFVLAPGTLIYGATSADALYMTLGLAAALALVAGPPALRAAGALMLSVASFFGWSLLGIGAWAAFVVLRREGLRRAIAVGLCCGVVLVAFYAVLYAATGFDPIGTFRATESVYRLGIATTRPYRFWLFGSPVAFLVFLGVPLMLLWLKAVGRLETLALATLAVIAVASLAGFTKAETERIWLFLAPPLCLAAATVLPDRWIRPVLGLLAAQALLVELLYDTVW